LLERLYATYASRLPIEHTRGRHSDQWKQQKAHCILSMQIEE
jgi:hypothetical protein